MIGAIFHAKIPKSTVFKQRYFGFPLLNFAPTPMVRRLVSTTIFRHYLFQQYFQSAAFIWRKKNEPVTQILGVKSVTKRHECNTLL